MLCTNENKIVSTCIPAGSSWQEAESHYTNYIFPATGARDPSGMGGGSCAHPQRAEKRHFITNGLEELTDINIYPKYISNKPNDKFQNKPHDEMDGSHSPCFVYRSQINRPGDAWRSKLSWHRAVAGNPERDSVSL